MNADEMDPDEFERIVSCAFAELPESVRKVLCHEIGHALGLGEARLRELGWY